MQNIVFYVAANEPLGTVRDYANAKNVAAPTLILGAACNLKMRLFANADGTDAYPLAELQAVASWQWQMDADFTSSTTRKIDADNSSITAVAVTAEIGGTEYTFTEVQIPISNMLTNELATYMAGKETASIAGELCGYDGTGALVFILQVKNFTVRGRISDTGTPTNLPDDYLNATQVNALLNNVPRNTAITSGARYAYPHKAGYVLVCTTAGTTAATVPTWPASVTTGTTTLADGTAVWTIHDTTAYAGTAAEIAVADMEGATVQAELQNHKTQIDQKAAATHTHTASDITNMPTIPADISDLTDTQGLLGGGGGLQKWNGTWTNVVKNTQYTAATDGWLRIRRPDDTGASAQVNIEITDLGTTYTTIVLPAASYASARQVEFRYIFSGQTYKWTGGTGVDNDAEVYFSPVAI